MKRETKGILSRFVFALLVFLIVVSLTVVTFAGTDDKCCVTGPHGMALCIEDFPEFPLSFPRDVYKKWFGLEVCTDIRAYTVDELEVVAFHFHDPTNYEHYLWTFMVTPPNEEVKAWAVVEVDREKAELLWVYEKAAQKFIDDLKKQLK